MRNAGQIGYEFLIFSTQIRARRDQEQQLKEQLFLDLAKDKDEEEEYEDVMRQETERLRLQGYTPRVRVYFFSVYHQWSLGTQLSQRQAFLSFVISLQLLPHPPHHIHFCLEFFSSCILYLPLFICLLGSIEMPCLVIVITGFLNVCPVCWRHHFLTSWFTGTYVQVFFFNCILWYKSCVDSHMWLLKC